MPDLLTDRLSRLAPEVDMTASRALFEARRDGARFGSPAPRRTWMLAAAVVALLVAGVVALAALTRDDPATTPLEEPDDAGTTLPTPVATGAEFELLLVEEVAAPFHELFVAGDQAELDAAWAALDPGFDLPAVAFDRHVAVVLTRPDNACPDTLERFRVDGSTWTPVFAVETGACNQPLLSWVYVVGVDRTAVAPELTVSLPADEVYDAPARTVTATIAAAAGGPSAAGDPELTETGVALPLPEVGRPELHATTLGFVWVVQHEDGTVSVLPALVDLPANEDEGGVAGLAALVASSVDGATFGGPRWEWDAWGRTIGGPRSEDLVGFVGRVDDGEVDVLATDADRVPGEPTAPAGASRRYGTSIEAQAPGIEPIDIETYLTLSSVLPRLLDATLVVEGGVGRICEIDQAPPVPDLATCGDGLVVATSITSSQPGITAWYFGPLLAEFDTVGSVSRVVSLGGLASRNDGLAEIDPAEVEVIVQSATAQCSRDGIAGVQVDLLAGAEVDVELVVTGGGGVLGRAPITLADGVTTSVTVELTALPDSPAELTVIAGDPVVVLAAADVTVPPDADAC